MRILPAQDLQILVSELAASHGPQLRRFLLARVRNTADVADIVQDVLGSLVYPSSDYVLRPDLGRR
jgi:DNA-directed RNA polymerase specialized sigma24 family protein